MQACVGEGSSKRWLLRWPIKLVVHVGFVMLALQGVSKSSSACALQNLLRSTPNRETDAMITLEMIPRDVCGLILRCDRFPVSFTLRDCISFASLEPSALRFCFLQAIPAGYRSVLSNELLSRSRSYIHGRDPGRWVREDMLDSIGQCSSRSPRPVIP